MLKAGDLFNFPDELPFGDIFRDELAPWKWVSKVKEACKLFETKGSAQKIPSGLNVRGHVFIHPSVKLPHYGSIVGPTYISEGTELRPGVFIRGNVITGRECTLGNACEFKNCLLLNKVQVPHFSYVGDSVLGNEAHLGAGVICSNLRLDQGNISVRLPDGSYQDTGMRKLGALIGDAAEVGCNAVLNPGSILGKQSLVMPTVAFKGYLQESSVALVKETIASIPRTD